jgi:ligand-binding sensor domain-containing protein
MTGNALARQPGNEKERNALRAIFRQYLQAGRDEGRLKWENITTREGLPHNWIYDLFQDSGGRIWAGTWGGGAARYESGRWQTFTSAQGLHSNAVTCIREDIHGRLWLATDGGLNVLDMETDRISDAGLAGKSLLNITFDPQGALWAGCWRAAFSGGGLYRYADGKWETFTTLQNLPGLEILKVFVDSTGRLWVGTYEQGVGAGVGCYDGKGWQKFTTRQGLVNDCVYSMFEDPSGNMWFGTIGGISIFDGRAWHTLTTKDGLLDNRVYCMLIDTHKKMWFGTEMGISRFDGSAWLSYSKKDGLVNNLVRAIIEARDSSLWLGTYPYAIGEGGISLTHPVETKSLTDHLLDLLPEPPQPYLLPPVKREKNDQAEH